MRPQSLREKEGEWGQLRMDFEAREIATNRRKYRKTFQLEQAEVLPRAKKGTDTKLHLNQEG